MLIDAHTAALGIAPSPAHDATRTATEQEDEEEEEENEGVAMVVDPVVVALAQVAHEEEAREGAHAPTSAEEESSNGALTAALRRTQSTRARGGKGAPLFFSPRDLFTVHLSEDEKRTIVFKVRLPPLPSSALLCPRVLPSRRVRLTRASRRRRRCARCWSASALRARGPWPSACARPWTAHASEARTRASRSVSCLAA